MAEGLKVGGQNLQSPPPVADPAVTLESVLRTEELNRRPARPPDYEKENRALVKLAQALADSPQSILQILADTILEVFQADSAGLSLLTTHDGGKRFHWPAIAGMWKPHIGGGTPRDFGPCGDVLDRNTPLLFSHFERLYTYFQPVMPPAEECLLVPFYIEGKAVGTIWAIAHDKSRKFDAEDMRQLVSLGRFASAAYQAAISVDAGKHLAAIVESSDDAIISKDFNGIIRSWNTGAERLFGYTAQEAIGQPVTMLMPPERVDEEPGILNKIRHGERIDHYETIRRRKDGTLLDVSLTVSPIVDSQGHVVGASKIARDITQRKLAEEVLKQSHTQLESQVQERTASLSRLSRQLLRMQDEQSRKIARELHDSVGQYLVGVKMNLASLAKPDLPKEQLDKLADTQELLERCISETRTISYLLHPPMLDEVGFASAANFYVEGFAKRSGIQAHLEVDPRIARLPGSAEIVLFRVLQESLTNVHRHAGSTKVDIRLSVDGDDVTLEVRDYGRGIPTARLKQFQSSGTGMGVGLAGIRERVSELGGSIEVLSENPGTLVRATIHGVSRS